MTTTTRIITTGRGWRNVFTLLISYDVDVVPQGTLLNSDDPQLIMSTGVHPKGYDRIFSVLDDEVDRIYGSKIRSYFVEKGIELTVCVIKGGKDEKRSKVRNRMQLY